MIARRRMLQNGLAAALWSAAPRARAQSPQPGEGDGYRPLRAAPNQMQILPEPAARTRILAFDDSVPGPLLRVDKGEPLELRFVNALDQPTCLSFPGLRMPNANAGIGGLSQPLVAPGASFDIAFTPPDSGFNLYMPHAGGHTAAQISSGLYGPIIVDEATLPAIDLESIVIISDWRLDAQGQLKDDAFDPATSRGAGRVGALVAVDGQAAPLSVEAVPGARVRLRLANATTARVLSIAIEGAKPLIVAIDGQPAESFEPLRNLIPMGPGARFDMLFDMPREAESKVRFTLRGGEFAGAPGEVDMPLILFAGQGAAVAPRPKMAGLAANPLLPAEIDLARARRLDLAIAGGGGAPFTLNGASFVDWAAKPLLAVPKGAPVTLGFANKTAVTQAMRLHGHVARLLHPLDDGWEPYWRDTILVAPGKTVHVAFVADNPGKWPIESAIPEHRAAGVGGWMLVQ